MDLLNHLKRKKLKLGMVIDFTNTFRYYNGKVKLQEKINNLAFDLLKCTLPVTFLPYSYFQTS